jgi:hypothetical protein
MIQAGSKSTLHPIIAVEIIHASILLSRLHNSLPPAASINYNTLVWVDNVIGVIFIPLKSLKLRERETGRGCPPGQWL